MSEDRLLRELGHLAREEGETEKARLDERWDRLAAGTLTAAEDAELRALAAASPEAREAYEAFRPLGPDFQARVVDTLAAEIELPEPKPEKQRYRLLPFRPAYAPLARWLTAAGTVAAGLLLLLLRNPAMPPLPAYAVLPIEGVKDFRGETRSTGLPLFLPGSLLTMVVQPQKAVDGPVEARPFLGRGAEILSWEPEPRLEIDGGAVRLRGTVGKEIRIPPGTWRIWIVVGRPGKLPSLSELQNAMRTGKIRDEAWQAVSADVRVEEQAPP